jgi:hypothetical protein
MTAFLKRNGFKTLEAIAEFLIYMPWMFCLYYVLFGDTRFFDFLPLEILFLMMGLFITDYLIAKHKAIYKISAYMIGAIPVAIAVLLLGIYVDPFFAAVYALYLIICYMRGLAFATHDMRVSYSQSKFMFGVGALMAAFALSVYLGYLRWFSGYIIWCAVVFIAMSIIILNQLQLVRMLDMMNAEAYATHRDVRFRNFIFSLIIIGLIVFIFQIKAIVQFLSLLVTYIGDGLRHVLLVVIQWLITWLNGLFGPSEQQGAAPPMDFSQFADNTTSPIANIIRAIMEVLFYVVAIAITAFLIYQLIKALARWISSMMERYTAGDEERSFILSLDDIVDRSSSLGQDIRRRMRRALRHFETPQQRIRFLYAQTIKRFADKGYEIKPQQTPDDIHSSISGLQPGADPEFKELTELYDKARYSHHNVSDEEAARAKRYRDRLFRMKL